MSIPAIGGIMETALYCGNLDETASFYSDVLGFELMSGDDRLRAFKVAPRQVLLLFRRGASLEPVGFEGGTIPSHDGSGPLHVAFSIEASQMPLWREWLDHNRVPVESEVRWPAGGTSLYFRDPENHCIELASPGIWPNYMED